VSCAGDCRSVMPLSIRIRFRIRNDMGVTDCDPAKAKAMQVWMEKGEKTTFSLRPPALRSWKSSVVKRAPPRANSKLKSNISMGLEIVGVLRSCGTACTCFLVCCLHRNALNAVRGHNKSENSHRQPANESLSKHHHHQNN